MEEGRVHLTELIESTGLSRVGDRLEAIARNAIRIRPRPVRAGKKSPGQSRFGGLPDLPPGFEWPSWRGVPQAFLAQLHLDEVAAHDLEGVLPTSGILHFFYDVASGPWGFDPASREGWKVCYFEGASEALAPTAYPAGLPDHGRFEPCSLQFEPELMLPAPVPEQIDYRSLALDDEEARRYWDLCKQLMDRTRPSPGPWHRLLGHPIPIQPGDMGLECQLASHGIYCGDAGGCEDPGAAALAPGAAEWRLLLQLDSDKAPGWMWGDAGTLYFWIPRQALHERRFDQAWTILQCY